jgi:hypothetical protein
MSYPRTPDGSYFVVRSRLWSCADPSIPDDERTRQTAALMDARRAVGAAPKQKDEVPLATARAAMDDAKIARGDAGPSGGSTAPTSGKKVA